MLQKKLLYLLAVIFIIGCSHKSESPKHEEVKTDKMINEEAIKHATGTIMLIVRVKTKLSEEELLKRAREREPQFEALPGLIQKYYIKLNSEGEDGGVYIWDSAKSLQAYKKSELAATIAQSYEATEAPSVEVVEILFQLRE